MQDKLISGNVDLNIRPLYNRAKAIKPENNGQEKRTVEHISQLRNILHTPSNLALLRKIFECLDTYTEQATTKGKVEKFLFDLEIANIEDLNKLEIKSKKLEAERAADPNLGSRTINSHLTLLATLTKVEFGTPGDILEKTKFPSCIGYLYDHKAELQKLINEIELNERLNKLKSKNKHTK